MSSVNGSFFFVLHFLQEIRGGNFMTREPWKPALEDPCDPENNIGQVKAHQGKKIIFFYFLFAGNLQFAKNSRCHGRNVSNHQEPQV